MKFIRNEEEAVSPVIGVILMVAIVVILAAVIAAFVFGMAGSVSTAKSIGVTAQYSSTSAAGLAQPNIVITYQGGNDDSQLLYLTIKVNDGAAQDTSTAPAVIPSTGVGTGAIKPKVGDKFYDSVLGSGTAIGPGTNKVVVTGTFVDGSTQVVLDTTV